MTKRLCEIFRSPNKEGMYLYVDKKEGLNQVPDALLQQFGKPLSAMTMLLDENRSLARAKAEEVLTAIEEQGFYLQMPPVEDDYMREINKHNSKL